MAKHRRSKAKQDPAKSQELVNIDSTARKLESLMTDPYFQIWSSSGAAAGIRRKVLSVDFTVLRNVVERVPLFNAIINTRNAQILPFCKRVTKEGSRGFKIINVKDPEKSKDEDPNIELLYEFFEQTGFSYSEDREDDLSDYVQMFVRDTIEVDQIATEIQYNRLGEACAFWALDPATVQRVDPEKSNFEEDVRFVQLINLKVENTYTHKTLIYDYMNKRSGIRHRGFGYSVIEQVIDVATSLLFGYNYARDQLVRDRVPKGFISVMGDIDGTHLESIRRYWYAAMSGAGGQWNIPILPSGKDGIGIDFKSLGQNNKDMEYHRTMMFFSSLIAAVCNIDLAELGIKTDDSQSIINNEGSTGERITASKDRGLGSLLAFIEQHLNKILRKVTSDYRFVFVGYEEENKAAKADLITKQIASTKSIDEIREAEGEKPYNQPWSKIPLNPYVVQMVQAQQQQEQQEKQAQQQQEQGGEEEDYGGEEDQFPYGSDSDQQYFKALTESKLRELLRK